MTCLNPKWIYLPKYLPIRNAEYEENQKRLRKISWHYTPRFYAVQIPCNECIGCLLDRAKEHATKCYCEMQDTGVGCFLTLTYNNGWRTIKGQEEELSLPLTEKGQNLYNELIKKYPHVEVMKYLAKMQSHNLDIMDLRKSDLQKFIKRLRKYLYKKDIKIRYLACGERGENFKRVHFHAVIFGWKPDDLKKYKPNHRDDWTYTSETLSKIWACGFCLVGELNFETASYTARYVQKKAKEHHEKPKREIDFKFRHTMTEVIDIVKEYHKYYDKRELSKNDYIQYFNKINSVKKIIKPKTIPNEFITMSNRPGIGLNYFLKNMEKIKENNGILIHIKKATKLMNIPKYYQRKWKEMDWENFYNWQYQMQVKAQQAYQKKINELNYPKDYTDWQKEIEFKNNRNRLFTEKIKKLIRKNSGL